VSVVSFSVVDAETIFH